jgi:undecaprenyl-diphosphatase
MIHRVTRFVCVLATVLAILALPVLAQMPAPTPAPTPVPANPSNVPIPTEPLALPQTPDSALTPHSNTPAPSTRHNMTLLQAAIIGVVEGITEYLPVSSTGHIILTQRALGIGNDGQQSKEAADAFAVCVQAGAIVAVLGLYFGRVKQGLCGLVGKDPVGSRLALNLLAGFIPALVLGALLSKTIKAHLFGLWPITFAWFAGGVAILAVTYLKKPKPSTDAQPTGQLPDSEKGFSLDVLNWQSALMVGLAQCIAMWPGTSRSLVTIVAGMLVGMSLSAAVEFSFLLGVITLTAATVKDLKDHGQLMLDLYGPLTLFVGFLAAFISAVGAVEWLVGFLKKHSMAVFGYYRVALAIVVAALLLANILHP